MIKKRCLNKGLLSLIWFCLAMNLTAQYTPEYYLDKLKDKSESVTALNNEIDITVNNASIQEFLRGVANLSGLNIDIEPSMNFQVTNNFTGVKVSDILVFICLQYKLDFNFIGNIVSIYKIKEEEKKQKLNIGYDAFNDLLTVDLKQEDLTEVVKEITICSGKNIILSPGLENIKISGYIQRMPFENALEKLAFSNNLDLKKTDDNFFVLTLIKNDQQNTTQSGNRNTLNRPYTKQQTRQNTQQTGEYIMEIHVLGNDSIEVYAQDAPLNVIIDEVSKQLGINFYIVSELQGSVSMNITGSKYRDFLKYSLNNTPYAFRTSGNIFIIGEKTSTGLKNTRVIKLQNRTTDKLVDFIPADLIKDAEIVEFPELNSLLVTGDELKIVTIENFIKDIDKTVPVILIEVIIVDVSRKYNISTGIEAKLGGDVPETGGTLFPGVDMTLSSSSVNDLLHKFNDFGWINIGNVTPDFYVTLKALENQGILNVRSTPKLSTLNGHEAELSIGNTEYYLEQQSNIYGTQNPQLTTSETYKAVEAELSVKIKPMVSSNDQITLEITVNQDDFTERISDYAPPGKVTRKFESIIRVKNQETILLGGLEEKRVSDTGSGVPLISRIPVIKWFFSSRTKEDSKSRLNIFIKPTIVN